MTRHKVSTRLQRLIRIEVEQGDGWRLAASVDLSLHGVCLQLHDDGPAAPPGPLPGERRDLRLHLPGRTPIETRGEVRWSDGGQREIGFQFLSMDPDDMLDWTSWLQGDKQ